jgi:general secretion pathway protein B
MSYILDALKKAEQERKLGKAPDFMDDQGRTPQQPGKRLWIYTLLMLVVAIAGGLGWWFGHEEPSHSKAPFQSSGVKQETDAQPLKAEPMQAAQPTSHEQEKPLQTASSSITTAAPVEQKKAVSVPKTEAPKEVKSPVKAEEPKKTVKDAAAVTANAKAQPAEEEEEGDSKPNPKKLYNYNELPEDVRKGLPEPVISTHIYSQERSERLVSVNGNIGREGQQLMPGVTLESVRPDGVILKYRGYRIRANLR